MANLKVKVTRENVYEVYQNIISTYNRVNNDINSDLILDFGIWIDFDKFIFFVFSDKFEDDVLVVDGVYGDTIIYDGVFDLEILEDTIGQFTTTEICRELMTRPEFITVGDVSQFKGDKPFKLISTNKRLTINEKFDESVTVFVVGSHGSKH